MYMSDKYLCRQDYIQAGLDFVDKKIDKIPCITMIVHNTIINSIIMQYNPC